MMQQMGNITISIGNAKYRIVQPMAVSTSINSNHVDDRTIMRIQNPKNA